MYCRKCGKQIDYDAEFCKECQETEEFFGGDAPKFEQPIYEQPTYGQSTYAQPQQEGNRMTGFGKALTSTILGFVSYIFLMVGFLGMIGEAEATVYYGYQSSSTANVGVGVVITLMGVAMAIVALIFGISSIRCFVKEKKANRLKPIATLVLGIVGVGFSGLTLFYLFIVLFTVVAVLLAV